MNPIDQSFSSHRNLRLPHNPAGKGIRLLEILVGNTLSGSRPRRSYAVNMAAAFAKNHVKGTGDELLAAASGAARPT